MTRLIEIEPTRRIGTSRRALTGRVALGSQGSAEFESSLERDWIEQLDFLPDVTALQVQPFALEYLGEEGQVRRYTPDVAAVWNRGGGLTETIVYEVKPSDELRNGWAVYRPRFVAAIRYCRARSWRFKIVNEKHIRVPRLAAIRFLRRYRRLPSDEDTERQLLTSLRTIGPTTVGGLLEATYWSPVNRATALPYLWKMIANFDVQASLDQPLSMTTPIWHGG